MVAPSDTPGHRIISSARRMAVRRKILRRWNPDEMNGDIVRGAVLAMGVLVATVPLTGQMPGSTGCQSDIVSATVVTTSCTHAEHQTQVLDLLVLWRGRAGWFQDAVRVDPVLPLTADTNLALAQRHAVRRQIPRRAGLSAMSGANATAN